MCVYVCMYVYIYIHPKQAASSRGCKGPPPLGRSSPSAGLECRGVRNPMAQNPSPWCLVGNGEMDPSSRPYNSPHNLFPHSLLRTRQPKTCMGGPISLGLSVFPGCCLDLFIVVGVTLLHVDYSATKNPKHVG